MKRNLISLAMNKWHLHSNDFRTMPERYNQLIAEKRALKMKISALSRSTIAGYPKNDFLSKETIEEAKNFLNDKTEEEIALIVAEINDIIKYNHSYVSMKSFIIDAEYKIRNHKNANSFGVEPDRKFCPTIFLRRFK